VDYDVIIVGGGTMGSAAAYHLVHADPSLAVLVVEKDSTYEHASTVLSDGNVRVQFNLEENIRISQYTLDVMETFADDMATEAWRPDPAARRQGNLFLVDAPGEAAARAGLARQQELGCAVEWLDAAEIAARFPPFAPEGLVGGTLGRRDGSIDPTAVLQGYRHKAIEMGAEYAADEVESLLARDGRMAGVRLVDGGDVAAPDVAVTAGAWSPRLTATVGVELPVVPMMRTVYVVASTVPVDGLPSVFLPSGAYAIPEQGSTWLMAWSQPDDPVGFEFRPAPRQRFTDMIWPKLVGRLPAFDQLRIEHAWAGLYAVNTLDGNAIVGEWPELPGLYVCTGFSGHGFQQTPAVTRYLAESIRHAPHELDLSRLGPERVLAGQPLHEHAGRLI
jgi:glycine/D-amino acid oxidase-like deaminating enzyme